MIKTGTGAGKVCRGLPNQKRGHFIIGQYREKRSETGNHGEGQPYYSTHVLADKIASRKRV